MASTGNMELYKAYVIDVITDVKLLTIIINGDNAISDMEVSRLEVVHAMQNNMLEGKVVSIRETQVAYAA